MQSLFVEGIAVVSLAGLGCGDVTQPTRQLVIEVTFVAAPQHVAANAIMSPVTVELRDSSGALVAGDGLMVTLGLEGTSGGILGGTTSTNAADGIASFDDLTIETPGEYVLTVNADGIVPVASDSFVVGMPFRMISAATTTACGVTPANEAYCWGGAPVGDPSHPQRYPIAVPGGHLFRTVGVGVTHACGLRVDSLAYCWGNGHGGRLGNGSDDVAESSESPVPVLGGNKFASLAVGAHQSCGITTDGDAWCWGASGSLGDGTDSHSATPVLVAGGHQWAMIGAGVQHACGITTSGAAYCWGSGHNGELGTGDDHDQLAPALVVGSEAYTTVAAGAAHTCALTTDGEMRCWGENRSGEFGNGTTGDGITEPVPGASGTFVAVGTATLFSCALNPEGGQALCWGRNGPGLGNGVDWTSLTPITVSGGHKFAMIDVGFTFACGVRTDGLGLCWGTNNAEGQLGAGTILDSSNPVPVRAPRSP